MQHREIHRLINYWNYIWIGSHFDRIGELMNKESAILKYEVPRTAPRSEAVNTAEG